jgi:hypothetical protein
MRICFNPTDCESVSRYKLVCLIYLECDLEIALHGSIPWHVNLDKSEHLCPVVVFIHCDFESQRTKTSVALAVNLSSDNFKSHILFESHVEFYSLNL